MSGTPALAYIRGDDTYGIDRSLDELAAVLAAAGEAPTRWRVAGTETTPASIAERVATSPLFGGGVLAIVSEPAALLRSKADREALDAAVRSLAPGNGLAFVEASDGSNRRSASLMGLEESIKAAGGVARDHPAPKEGRLAAWIDSRARERGVALEPGAASELARRVGGFVREGDVDRRGQGGLAVAELEKLALYKPDGQIAVDDVKALVAEVVPDSTWALLDAIADRRAREAASLLDRLLDTTPEPVLLVQLHRRIRELIEVADHLERGASAASLVRTLKLKPFRAEKLAGQARRWSGAELEAALEGLLELDANVKGAPDAQASERQRRLGFTLWVEECVAGR